MHTMAETDGAQLFQAVLPECNEPSQTTSGAFSGGGRASRLPETVNHSRRQRQAGTDLAVIMPYSITWSARSRKASEIVNPSAFAVFKLMINSNLVGLSTGSSPGRLPLRTLSVNAAARR